MVATFPANLIFRSRLKGNQVAVMCMDAASRTVLIQMTRMAPVRPCHRGPSLAIAAPRRQHHSKKTHRRKTRRRGRPLRRRPRKSAWRRRHGRHRRLSICREWSTQEVLLACCRSFRHGRSSVWENTPITVLMSVSDYSDRWWRKSLVVKIRLYPNNCGGSFQDYYQHCCTMSQI